MLCPPVSHRAGRRPPYPSPVCTGGGHPEFALLNSSTPRLPRNPSGCAPDGLVSSSGRPLAASTTVPQTTWHPQSHLPAHGGRAVPFIQPSGTDPACPRAAREGVRTPFSEPCSASHVTLPPGAERSGAQSPFLPVTHLVTMQTMAGRIGPGGRPPGEGAVSGEQEGTSGQTPGADDSSLPLLFGWALSQGI